MHGRALTHSQPAGRAAIQRVVHSLEGPLVGVDVACNGIPQFPLTAPFQLT